LSERVLVVEDDDAARQLIGEILRDAGFVVALAANGAEGLAHLAQSRPDGIILDLLMPQMDGMDFLLEARKRQDCEGIPVIVLSTSAHGGDLLVGTLGVRAALAKPFELNELLAVIARVFENDQAV